MSEVLRSMLYVPSNSWRMINNAVVKKADAIILDLEDAVSIDEKETGRVFARDSLPMIKEAGMDIYVRVNALHSGLLEKDLQYIITKCLDGIILAKAESAKDVVDTALMISEEEAKKSVESDKIKLIPLIESPLGVENVSEIARSSERIVGIAFGAGDYLRELGVGFAVTRLKAAEYFPALQYARSRIANAAKIAEIEAIDTPFFGLLIDIEALRTEAESVKLLGFTGKQLVHPQQIDTVNMVFKPSEEDEQYAKNMVNAYSDAKSKGLGSASYQGRMIDYAMYKMGMDLLNKAKKISERDKITV